MQQDKPLRRVAPGTFAAVIHAFQASPRFRRLSEGTQSNYNRAFRSAETHEGLGGLPVEVMRPALVQAYLDALTEGGHDANGARVALSSLESWAIVRDLLPRAIMTGVSVDHEVEGHEPWTIEQVNIAKACASDMMARVVTLALHTGQRGSDVVRMRQAHLQRQSGRLGINVTQKKTKRRLWIPFDIELARVFPSWQYDDYMVRDPEGRPYTRPLLSCHWTRERDSNPALAALAGLTLHGLRATAIVRARRDGLTELQIGNLYGMSEQMVARYSKLANQTEMALSAITTLDRVQEEKERPVDEKVLRFPRR